MPGVIGKIGYALRDWLLPPRCLGCGVVVSENGALCPSCWAGLHRITRPRCDLCGLPLLMSPPGHERCEECDAEPPAFLSARAALIYDDASKPLVLRFKHGDRLDFAPGLARLMLGAGGELLAASDVLIPIPLHRARLRRRRFNQAAELARCLAQITALPHLPLALMRTRPTPPQGGLTRIERMRNLSGAFAMRDGHADAIADKRVLLIDDVHTTGATLNEASRALLHGGAAEVRALTVCHALPRGYKVDDDSLPI